MTNISPGGIDTSLDEIDPLFAQATVVQASEYRHRHRHHHRSRRKQRRNRMIIGGLMAAAVVAAGAVAYAATRDNSPATPVATVGGLPSTTAAAAKTTPTTAKAAVAASTWTYKDLKGQTVVVHATNKGTTRFVATASGPMPYVIVNIDKAFATKGCEGGEAAYQQWNPVTPAALATARYSAYTRYAVDKGKAMNCPWAATITTP